MADPEGSGSAQEAQQEAGDQSKPGGEDGRGAGHADASDDAEKALDAEAGGEASFAQQALISKYAQVYQDWNAATKGLKGEKVVTRRLYEFLQEWQTGLPDRGERDGNDEREAWAGVGTPFSRVVGGPPVSPKTVYPQSLLERTGRVRRNVGQGGSEGIRARSRKTNVLRRSSGVSASR
uniref:Uncharacterized protein n=1 Tax=Chromera velia CCMP2878 TaxID=1169474 RepID=A0A0G4FQD0_9ALVE|eukprot:Cvel_3621.t1-p1 / transcript=Cvel_3621.t1 / gene=Cvel_3621 / organism=Chromera_velia_CCMP2878 / gene_product=hypothetical protein / transcript_product=hypothetical protein / location=Cvel_scaffold148:111883-113133(-) / protein_length=178 / sequence_SO=supercontig / SO=protein_coding / is_pseudo=false